MIKDRLKRIAVNFKRFGLFKTIKYLFYNGFIKRIKNRISYARKNKEYSQNIIFITSLPKSGSTWLSNMCAEIDGFDLFAPSKWNTYITKEWDDTRWDLNENTFNEFQNNLAVIRGHTLATAENIAVLKESKLKYIIGVRDPRDKLVSEYYHSRNFPGHWAHDFAIQKSLEEFITYKLESGEFERETIKWIRDWIFKHDKNYSIIIRYEDLLSDTNKVFTDILKYLDFKIDEKKIKTIIEKHSFKNVSGRDSGEEDNTKFVRKGISGEWKTNFTNEQKVLFAKIGEDIIKELNYEPTLLDE